VDAPGGGWLSPQECEEAWDAQEPWSAYVMSVELVGEWFRDEADCRGELRPMCHVKDYIQSGRLGQKVRWDGAAGHYVFVPPCRHICYRGLVDTEWSPASFVNDACFGKFDGQSDEYSAADECLNALVMVPCLRKVQGASNKVEFNSVWYYPREGWQWTDEEQEVTCGYHWPLEPWMRPGSRGAAHVT
jgi:hypothetical protein